MTKGKGMRKPAEEPRIDVASEALDVVERIASGILSFIRATRRGRVASRAKTARFNESISLIGSILENENEDYSKQNPLLQEEFRIIWGAWEKYGEGSTMFRLGDASVIMMLSDLMRDLQHLTEQPNEEIWRLKPTELSQLIRDKVRQYRAIVAKGQSYERPYELVIVVQLPIDSGT